MKRNVTCTFARGLLLAVLFCANALLCGALESSLQSDRDFLKSFITHYEFNLEGRYTHEYHPFLLDWTAKSFDELEHCLQDQQFNMHGRMIIMGYEENAIPNYYTDFKRSKINDEAMRKSFTGWSQRTRNRFGFMTGFVLKDIEALRQRYLVPDDAVFRHIDVGTIPIFDHRAALFHEHAFGQALPLIVHEQDVVAKKLVAKEHKDVLRELTSFWQKLYSGAFKAGGSQIAGTQDVLFSIALANHLLRSPLPLFKFFIGPDLTYPIEVTAKQDRFATAHAQSFINEFVKQLKPINQSNTAYVFCSFVDGVGKSTMLGNIKNWIRFGSDIESFEHVDNSSSQLCDLFQFSDKVFIADMPAQMSHFTYKPDGMCFVDVRTCFSSDECKEVERVISEQKEEFISIKNQIFDHVHKLIASGGFEQAELNNPSDPLLAYAKNVVLLKRGACDSWVPFSYNGKYYLFKNGKAFEPRVLMPLGNVKSEGLKNIEAEQMLFFSGIRMPLPYKNFLQDFINQLKSSGISEIVFVDFLSMYPRSSRENVRVNYLLQQMAHLDAHFSPEQSMYKDFVSGGELLHTLLESASAKQLTNAFELEASVRLALFNVLINRTQGDLTGFDITGITPLLRQECARIVSSNSDFMSRLMAQKIDIEKADLEKTYGQSKSFVNILQLSFDHIAAFSSVLRDFFVEHISHEGITTLWRKSDVLQDFPQLRSAGDRLLTTAVTVHGERLNTFFGVHRACRQEMIIAPLLRSLRASWYASIMNLIAVTAVDTHTMLIEKERYKGIPLFFLQGDKDTFFAVQPRIDLWDGEYNNTERTPFKGFPFCVNRVKSYGLFYDQPYRLDWDCKTTNSGMFAFDCSIDRSQAITNRFDVNTISYNVQTHQSETGVQSVIFAHDLYKKLQCDESWISELRHVRRQVAKNGVYKPQKNQPQGAPRTSSKVYAGLADHKNNLRYMIRLLATLEMVVKDPDADIVVRYGNRHDFKAALKLFEESFLVNYCYLFYPDGLFDDYDAVEPYPSWDYWDSVAISRP